MLSQGCGGAAQRHPGGGGGGRSVRARSEEPSDDKDVPRRPKGGAKEMRGSVEQGRGKGKGKGFGRAHNATVVLPPTRGPSGGW